MRFYISRLLVKTVLLLTMFMVAAIATPAYTIVLRSGERVRIPDRFRMTETTLTYEIAQSITRTILVNSIDIDATERANNEPAGGLRRRIIDDALSQTGTNASSKIVQQPRSDTSVIPRPTLTNEDLADLRRRGANRKQAYELQRQTLPAPTAEQIAEDVARISKLARELDADRAERIADAESFYAAQSRALRFEFAEVNTELRYWRARLAQATSSSLTALATPATTLVGIPPIAYPFNFGGLPVAGTIFAAPNVYAQSGSIGAGSISTTTTASGTSLGVRIGVGGGNRGRVDLGGGYSRRDVRSSQTVRGSSHVYVPPFGSGAGFYGFGGVGFYNIGLNEITQLRDRIRELEAARGRLIARERLLEDEARRAGIAPGVLRP